ncbi:M24 family metallopeptidase [Alphaproteobacteria bacterium GH1-50]|uniref:M24 family metallopeptidase n=1 Tax=Kangsaoukella pontilimi TaxID=2691042 RepID=A0A7C9MFP5_9RHOB|nr:Xaa-Pro peptidase family protein [Kangsaoukella pontilimi]MXQ09691.1 M24 family metallopeptidase [Kangsaoukella pontilimi]
MTGARGFPAAEYRGRVARAQAQMSESGLDALLLTTEPDIRYFTGFLTRFWESPTRPWFLVLPAGGDPVAVIPGIGAALMAETWISDIRTWASPDLSDDGVSLLAASLADMVSEGGRIGVPFGPETHLRMPLDAWRVLAELLGDRDLTGDAGILRRLRMVKSPAEIAKIQAACDVAGRAFDRVPEIACAGIPLSEVFRRFQMLCLDEGADWVSYLAGGAGPGGYLDVIRPATDAPLAVGDLLMLDTGAVLDGYFCDFDRNFSIGPPAAETEDAHARLIEATAAGFNAARPGVTAADLFHAMDSVLTDGEAPEGAGRLGHGLGMQLTEWPSLMPADKTVLEAGMVLTLEPGLSLSGGRIMVHEENIVITETGAEWLTRPSPPEIVCLEGRA